MSKKFKIAIICVSVVLAIFFVFCLIAGGGTKGVVTPDKQKENIASVVATDSNLQQHEYQMETLTNNVEFDEEIQLAKYNNIKFNISKDIKVKGFAFVLRTENDTKFRIKVFNDGNLVASKDLTLQGHTKAELSIMLDTEVSLTESSNFSLEIDELQMFETEETTTELEMLNNTEFVFDKLVVLFSED